MTRRLTPDEETAMQQARTDLMSDLSYDSFTMQAISATYRQAWKDCLDYQQSKLDALIAYISGKITRAELEATVPEVK